MEAPTGSSDLPGMPRSPKDAGHVVTACTAFVAMAPCLGDLFAGIAWLQMPVPGISLLSYLT